MFDELRDRRVRPRVSERPPQVRALMAAGVVTASPGGSLTTAASVMRDRRVGALVVCDGDRVAGILTERDLLRAMADGRDPDRTAVSEYMSPDPVTIEADLRADRAAALMASRRIRHLPVTDGGRLVGFISARDLLATSRAPAGIAEPW